MKNGIALGTLLLASLASAQGREGDELLPKDAFLVARVAGPSRLGEAFRGTKWGAAFADAALRAAAEKSLPTWELVIEGTFEDDAPLVQGLLSAAWNFPGRATCGVGWDAARGGEGAQWSVVFDGAPEADLEKLRDALTKLLPGDAARTLTLGDQKLEAMRLGTGAWLTKPVSIGGVLAMFGGNQAMPEGDLASTLHGASATPLAIPQAPFSLHLDGHRALSVLAQQPFESARAGSVDPRKMLRALGVDALTHLNLTFVPEGDRVRAEMEIQLDSKAPHGLFRFWTEAGAGGPPATNALLQRVPEGHALWTTGRMRFDLIPTLLRDAMTAAGEAAPMTWEEAMAKATEFVKVDLEKEIFARLGSEYLTLQNMSDEAPELPGVTDPRREMRMQQAFGTCFVLAIREGAAFGKAVDRMLRSRGLHAARKSVEVAGTKVYSLNLLSMLPVHYAVTEDHLYCALGDSAGVDLRAALQHGALPATESRPSPITPALAREIGAMPVPVLGFGVERTTELIETLAQQMSSELGSSDPEEAEMMQSLMLPILELPNALRRAKLGASATVIGGDRNRLLWRWVQ